MILTEQRIFLCFIKIIRKKGQYCGVVISSDDALVNAYSCLDSYLLCRNFKCYKQIALLFNISDSCPTDWLKGQDGNCYKGFSYTSDINLEAAKAICENESSDIVQPETYISLTSIVNANFGNTDLWTGIVPC